MSRPDCIQIEQRTRGQSNSKEWFQDRKQKLTSSQFGLIIKRKKISDSFIQSLINPKQFNSAPTSYGISNEKNALDQYIKTTGNHIHDCGLVVNHNLPFLGATPDAKVCYKGITGIIEVKCPYSARDLKIDNACTDLPDFCLEIKDGVKSLKKTHNYFYQVQGQLLITGVTFCDFVVFTKKDLFIQRIEPDVKFMSSMVEKLHSFFVGHVKPQL